MRKRITRRRVVQGAGVAGAAYAVAQLSVRLDGLGHVDTADAADACTLTPAKTEGPYFVDEKLNRADIRANKDGSAVQPGALLTLDLTILDADGGCTPVSGAQVDIWHANAAGKYSDKDSEGTTGQSWLRGYQVTGADGKVSFTTVYPGWYSGRCVHIHCKVRGATAGGAVSNYNTQFFFDDATNSTVEKRADLGYKGTDPNVTDGADSIYGSDGSSLLLKLTGDAASGFAAAYTLNLSVNAKDTGAVGGGPGGPGGTPPSTPPGGTGTTDEAVGFALASTTFRRTSAGKRELRLTVKATETVAFKVLLVRGGKTLASKLVTQMDAGTGTLKLTVPDSVRAGTARLQLVVVDTVGNTKRYDRKAVVPRRPS